jgi:hypothetical protein
MQDDTNDGPLRGHQPGGRSSRQASHVVVVGHPDRCPGASTREMSCLSASVRVGGDAPAGVPLPAPAVGGSGEARVAKRQRSMPRALADPRAAQAAMRSGRASNALRFVAVFSGILVAVAVLGAVLVAGANSSRDSRIDLEVSALLAGIPQKGQTLGARTAPAPWPGYRLYEEPWLKPGFINDPCIPSLSSPVERSRSLLDTCR